MSRLAATKLVSLDLGTGRTNANVAPTGIDYFTSYSVYSSDATLQVTARLNDSTEDALNLLDANLLPGAVFDLGDSKGLALYVTNSVDAGKTLKLYFIGPKS